MADPESWSARRTRWMNRLHARLSARAAAATAFSQKPEPRTIGSYAKGRQLIAGNLQFGGHLLEAKGAMLWDLDPPDAAFEEEIHGFVWLDDLAAVGDPAARELAQRWLWGWIVRFGRGKGPGWVPELTGRRLIRWTHHALFLLRGAEGLQSQQFYQSLAHQSNFLGRRWQAAPSGVARFEALTGLLYAGLALDGMGRYVLPARSALGTECRSQVDAQGGIPTRNPEELLEVFTLLTWASAALDECGKVPEAPHLDAIDRIAPTLRTLRHADGGLARFHGGGRGLDGRLDQALAMSGAKNRHADGLAMGYARLSAGRTSVIVDAAAPPSGTASLKAHASTLAFELTSGRRPLIVNCGSGAVFGEDWRRAGRATPSHSTLTLDGYSSARLGKAGKIGAARLEALADIPRDVPIQITHAPDGIRFEGGHDGYRRTHGLTHARTLELTFDGSGLVGEDLLIALDETDERQFDRRLSAAKTIGIPFKLRFHLHPEVDSAVDLGGSAVSLALRSGEVWVFRHEGSAELALEASVYLEKGRLRPRATKQIVLTGRSMGYATRIRWSLAKPQDTKVAIRDLARDDIEVST
ncbi:heparinase II/III family protein [Primorskyibacter flagellatus]|uniref:heparinase II/III family protein n=1 Tax=Primorskyibacter flagellatus TaxID=1387277 RepID=UPI003A8F5360